MNFKWISGWLICEFKFPSQNLNNEAKLASGGGVSKPPDTTAKRNKQQRQFNTFVRESINQLLGPDFMRTHDVQDIDAQVMEMIRSKIFLVFFSNYIHALFFFFNFYRGSCGKLFTGKYSTKKSLAFS